MKKLLFLFALILISCDEPIYNVNGDEINTKSVNELLMIEYRDYEKEILTFSRQIVTLNRPYYSKGYKFDNGETIFKFPYELWLRIKKQANLYEFDELYDVQFQIQECLKNNKSVCNIIDRASISTPDLESGIASKINDFANDKLSRKVNFNEDKDAEIKNWIAYYKGKPFSGIAYTEHAPDQLEFKISFKDGKRNGPYIWYWENGKILENTTYKDGIEDGLSEIYEQNGQLIERDSFNLGFKVFSQKFENGKLRSMRTYNKDYGTSFSESYYGNGQVRSRFNHKNQKLDGSFERYLENGKLIEKGTYKNGLKVKSSIPLVQRSINSRPSR